MMVAASHYTTVLLLTVDWSQPGSSTGQWTPGGRAERFMWRCPKLGVPQIDTLWLLNIAMEAMAPRNR